MFVMENALYLIMSQAVRYLREPNFPPRDKQLLKRELSAELVSSKQTSKQATAHINKQVNKPLLM